MHWFARRYPRVSANTCEYMRITENTCDCPRLPAIACACIYASSHILSPKIVMRKFLHNICIIDNTHYVWFLANEVNMSIMGIKVILRVYFESPKRFRCSILVPFLLLLLDPLTKAWKSLLVFKNSKKKC